MTFQPPSSPPGGTPPPPPPSGGQWGQPPAGGPGGNKPAFDPKTVNPLDWGILGAGLLAFIFSLFAYYKAEAFGISESESAFGDGFFGWFAALLALAGAAVVAVHLFMPHIKMAAAPRLISLGLFAIAFLCSLITLFLNPTDVPDKYFSHGFGYWASFILIIAATVLSLMRFQQTGGQLPGGMNDRVPNIGGYGPQGGISGGQSAQPPAPGTAPGAGPGSSAAPPPPAPGTTPPPPPPGYGQSGQ